MNDQNKLSTSTQIRNFYSDGMSCLNLSFYNTSLSLKFSPFLSKNNIGKSTYDMKNSLLTSIGYEAAALLSSLIDDIISGKIQTCDSVPIECAPGSSLSFYRSIGNNGIPETILSITKNNTTIPFKFNTTQCTVVENGQRITKTIENGLKAVQKTIDGYLTGINASRHLNKMTEDYAKLQENNNQNNSNNYQQNKNNGGYNNGYKRYNNNNYQNRNNNQQTQNHQNMSSYQIQ